MLLPDRSLKRIALEGAALLASFMIGWLIAFAVGGTADAANDRFWAEHGYPPPDPVNVRGWIPPLLFAPFVLLSSVRLAWWLRRRGSGAQPNMTDA